MSFGWSAGDIVCALQTIYNLIEALDSIDGAASDFREAVDFFRNLQQTLEPLQRFTAWNAYPTYGDKIADQVAYIKQPVEEFLAAVVKYEPSLGRKIPRGHHRDIGRKLQWHAFGSKKVAVLKKKVESHMRIIDTLLQRLTLDILQSFKDDLSARLRIVFEDYLRPELINVLRENLTPIGEVFRELRSQASQHEATASQLSESAIKFSGISADLDTIKIYLTNPPWMDARINLALRGCTITECPNQLLKAHQSESAEPISRESLSHAFYLVFMCFAQFLQSLFGALTRICELSRALIVPASDCIRFLDAIGRAPRMLPYTDFRGFRVLEALIQHEFKTLPGASWVANGSYCLLRADNNGILTDINWATSVSPGSTIIMTMLVRRILLVGNTKRTFSESALHCPVYSCTGTWGNPRIAAWDTCPVCQKEVFTDPSRYDYPNSSLSFQEPLATVSHKNSSFRKWPTRPATSVNIDPNEIMLFKRIIRINIELESPLFATESDQVAYERFLYERVVLVSKKQWRFSELRMIYYVALNK